MDASHAENAEALPDALIVCQGYELISYRLL